MEMNTNTRKIKNDEIPPLKQLENLISSLEQATLISKQLLTATVDPIQIHHIYTIAHNHLTSFLLSSQAVAAAATSFSSTSAAENAEPEPMQLGDDTDAVDGEPQNGEEDSKYMVDKVEERMRDCFIRNKRKKRPISPSLAAETEFRRVIDDGVWKGEMGFDPNCTKFRSLDLIYQFHG